MSTASDPFRHLAVFFHDVDGLVATLEPMLTEALARGDLVWAAVDDPARGALERRGRGRRRRPRRGHPARAPR